MACSGKYLLLTTCILQLVATIQRQIFDFLGYMWAPIFANFLQIIIVILGFFGAYQCKLKYIFMYTIWTLLWIGWNVFIICFYMEVGTLNRNSSILNMGTGSRSWWEVNGSGCRPLYNFTGHDPVYFPAPSLVEGCLVQYYLVESVQAGLQCFLAVIGLGGACCIFCMILKDDDSSIHRQPPKTLPYSIEYRTQSPPEPNVMYQRPMTPRKVKQRSTRSKRGSRRRYYQNPVTKLINASSVESCHSAGMCVGQSNPMYTCRTSSQSGSRPSSILFLNGRPSPIYMNDSDTVI